MVRVKVKVFVVG